jgi:hypothetical protein
MLPKEIFNSAAQTVSSPSRDLTFDSSTECILEPELTDFCSRLNITPVIMEFHDDDDDCDIISGSVSNHSSDIEEESEITKFTQALQDAQIAASKRENKKRRGVYSKKSSNTLKRRKHALIDLVSNGFLPLDEYIRRKGIPVKYNKPTPPKADKTSLQEESEESSDEALESCSVERLRLPCSRLC